MSRHKNEETLTHFLTYCAAQGVGARRREDLDFCLRFFVDQAPKPFAKLTTQDCEALAAALDRQPLAEWTKYSRKAAFKKLMRYATGQEKPKVIQNIRLRPPKDKLTKNDLLTWAELQSMLNQMGPGMAALIATLYDGNFRKGELEAAKVGDLHIRHNYAELDYHISKTQIGTKVLTISLPYILAWKQKHPRWENDAPLFMTWHTLHHAWVPVRGWSIGPHMKTAAKKAGVKKRVYAHLLRHSRTTKFIRDRTPKPIVEKSGGWAKDSPSVRRYEHLDNTDYEEEILRQAGIIDVPQSEKLTVRVCPFCGDPNPPGPERCWHCKQPLDLEKAGKEEQQKQTEIDTMLAEWKALKAKK